MTNQRIYYFFLQEMDKKSKKPLLHDTLIEEKNIEDKYIEQGHSLQLYILLKNSLDSYYCYFGNCNSVSYQMISTYIDPNADFNMAFYNFPTIRKNKQKRKPEICGNIKNQSIIPELQLLLLPPIPDDSANEPELATEKEKEKEKEKVNIQVEINNLEDLLQITQNYKLDDNIEYNINVEALHHIKPHLEELNAMIGMKQLKESILNQLLYYIQNLHKVSGINGGDFMHTVIYGPPGSGKTEVAKIIGKIFCHLGILKNGKFKKVVRNDLIAGYLGQTAIKTKDVILDCLGGVLFIDEAYALGNPEKKDSFSKECIDTLCEALSNYKDEFMVIIAGYEKELNESFFNLNQGLDSRFTWRFSTDKYTGADLYLIFLKKVKECGWKYNDCIHAEWFQQNIDYFKFNGRDIEVLLSKTKIAHSRRVFCKPAKEKTVIIMLDLEKGFQMFLNNAEVKNRKNDLEREQRWKMMYS